jgi:hypothetical protein
MSGRYDSTKADIFEKVWEYDLAHGTIAIGWTALGDTSNLSKSELEAKFEATYGEITPRDVNAIWRFYNEISVGDVVVARRGTKGIVGIGTVTGPAFYDEEAGQKRVAHLTDHVYSNFLPVRWDAKQIDFGRIVFSFYTIYEIPEERFNSLVEGVPPEEEDEVPEASAEFVLEKYLEDFIVTNLDRIFGGQLQLYTDPEGAVGLQYPTEVGYIDILARDRSTGSYVVIELKKGRPSDEVVGQILRYMGWVAENLCHEGQDVRGVIICRDSDDRLRYALKMVQNAIKAQFYEVDFRLKDSP